MRKIYQEIVGAGCMTLILVGGCVVVNLVIHMFGGHTCFYPSFLTSLCK